MGIRCRAHVRSARRRPGDRGAGRSLVGRHHRDGSQRPLGARSVLSGIGRRRRHQARKGSSVLVVPSRAVAGEPADASEILCAVDFSECSKEALRQAMELGTTLGHRLTVLHVVPPVVVGDADIVLPVEVIGVHEAGEREAGRELANLLASEAPPGLAVTELVRTGAAPVEIVAAAAARHAWLIVVGTHGRTAVQRILFGSTTHRVLREARCAVMTVPEPVRATAAAQDADRVGSRDRRGTAAEGVGADRSRSTRAGYSARYSIPARRIRTTTIRTRVHVAQPSVRTVVGIDSLPVSCAMHLDRGRGAQLRGHCATVTSSGTSCSTFSAETTACDPGSVRCCALPRRTLMPEVGARHPSGAGSALTGVWWRRSEALASRLSVTLPVLRTDRRGVAPMSRR
jgi:nucleotide-binding universal stress UspA family protein